jgi:phosphoribosylformylglycinamidine synthase
MDPFVLLFAESAGRAIVAVPRSEEGRFTEMCTARGLSHARIGVVDVLSADLEISDQFTVPLAELRAGWATGLRTLFDA